MRRLTKKQLQAIHAKNRYSNSHARRSLSTTQENISTRKYRITNRSFRPSSKPTSKIWSKTWHIPVFISKDYNFQLVHKKNLAYYIQVSHNSKELMSIPLKPLLIRGVSGLLQMNGIPIDAEILTQAVEKSITFHNYLSKI